ncbi:hypothetical protein D3C72_1804140 [compost metagenome]
MRVVITGSDLAAATSIAWTSFKISFGWMTSGSNLIWKEAFAGQISVTPLIFASLMPVVIDSELKKASSDISSEHSTKRCSSPPNV